jgi:hypothetical protein
MGVEAGTLLKELIKVWVKEAICRLGSNQVLAANFWK